MTTLRPAILALATLALLSACAAPGAGLGIGSLRFPGVFKANIQQGNVVTQDMVDQLEPGMTRRQVAFIMGEPILGNTFRSDQWNYVYTIQVGSMDQLQHQLTLFFDGDALVGFQGDFVPSPIGDSMGTGSNVEG